ncbi:MAG: prepilin-type N-terminal cleavage/methylation domain-containing protein [bacterium]
MKQSIQRGFTLIELLVVITIIGILAAIALPNYIKAKDKAKEAEVKANCHTLQIALERYATDHSGAYPSYILGGDIRGWDERNGCWVLTWYPNEPQRPPRDPLIHYAYVSSYPDNAFVDPGEGLTSVINWTSPYVELGAGDIRFGFTGEVMGNTLDDPRYLWSAPGMSNHTRLRWTMLEIPSQYMGVLDPSSPASFYCMGGMPQWIRGNLSASDTNAQPIKAFWPGEFFYRSGGDFFIANPLTLDPDAYDYIWDWPYIRVNKYMLGGYGSPRTDGLDVIRLTKEDGQTASIPAFGPHNGFITGEHYQDHNVVDRDASHPDYSTWIFYSNPEVFGGGERGLMPQFPYLQSGTRAWMFGAPDGYRDGVILVLTSGSDSAKFTEWQG